MEAVQSAFGDDPGTGCGLGQDQPLGLALQVRGRCRGNALGPELWVGCQEIFDDPGAFGFGE